MPSTDFSDDIIDTVYKKLEENEDLKKYGFKGMWLLDGSKDSTYLKTSFFRCEKWNDLDDSLRKEIMGSIINIDHSSIGNKFRVLNRASRTENKMLFISDSFEDPGGAVCYIDSRIGQLNAALFLIKKKDEILGLVDLFFDHGTSAWSESEVEEKIWGIFDTTFKDKIVYAFLIKESETIAKLGGETSAVTLIERYNKEINNTPFFALTDKDKHVIDKEYIFVNDVLILNILKHEKEYCSYYGSLPGNCPHHENSSQKNCNNQFLDFFFYRILSEKTWQFPLEIAVNQTNYVLILFLKNEFGGHEEYWTLADSIEIEKEVSKHVETYLRPKDKYLSVCKIEEELIIKSIKIRNNDKNILAVKLFKKNQSDYVLHDLCTPEVIQLRNANGNLNETISPEKIRLDYHYYQSSYARSNNLYLRVSNPRLPFKEKNSEHLKLLTSDVFDMDEYKKLLRNKLFSHWDTYAGLLKVYGYDSGFAPYNDNYSNANNDYNLHFVGHNPIAERTKGNIYCSLIRGQLNSLTSILAGNNAIREAMRTAIAQVMSRNLSHNIGSHVLPEYRTYFNNFFNQYLLDPAITNKPDPESYRNNLNHYFKYTQNRMELTADITIHQEMRVPFNYALFEIENEFKQYQSNLLMGLFDMLNKRDEKKDIRVKFTGTKGKNAFLPGGQLGKSAFYLIVENVLRNYYKHSNRSLKDGHFNFGVHISEPDDINLQSDYWCVDLYDCHGNINHERRGENRLLSTINDEHINAKILKDGKLRPSGWGFIEMKAACAYLINYPLSEIDNSIREFNGIIYPEKILQAAYYELDTNNNFVSILKDDGSSLHLNLGYRFYLKKAKLLFIDDELINEEQKEILNQLKSEGIEYGKLDRDNGSYKRSEHELLITRKTKDQLGPVFNQRYLCCDVPIFTDGKDLLIKAWEEYIKTIESRPEAIFFNPNHSVDKNKFNIAIDYHGSQFGTNPNFSDLKKLGLENSYFLQDTFTPSFPKEIVDSSDVYCPEIGDRLRVIETAKIKISIFDERIQKETDRTTPSLPNLTLRDVLELQGTFIPCIDEDKFKTGSLIQPIDLDKVGDGSAIEFWQRVKYCLGEENESPDDYVIVHYTLFEKVDRNGMDLQNFFNNIPSTQRNRLVFCSGRGRPSNLVKGCMYLNLSTLQEVVIASPNKFALVNILKSL